jgi:acylphosphatase
MAPNMTISKHVIYTGRVQGVGFRYTAQGLAASYPAVAGYVRNLPSGEVELAAEGPADQVEAYLAALATRMAHYIRQAAVSDREPAGYRGFTIRY